MAAAFLIVRTRLTYTSDRQKFDDWYRTEHFPDAVKSFGALRGWRSWSRTNPLVHIALYEFSSVEEAEAALDSEALTRLSAVFDRAWGPRHTRTREIVELAEELIPR
ncbi:MAG: hypothetical protein U1E60_17165 [Reyranellaceae bacterium]